MTDRHAGYVVTLTEDMREDDAQQILDAIGLIKGVLSVTPVIGDMQQVMADERARAHMRVKVADFLRKEL